MMVSIPMNLITQSQYSTFKLLLPDLLYECKHGKRQKQGRVLIEQKSIFKFENKLSRRIPVKCYSQVRQSSRRQSYEGQFTRGHLTFPDLIALDNSVTANQTNFQGLALKIFKIRNDIAPEIINGLLKIQESTYNVKNFLNSNFHQNLT